MTLVISPAANFPAAVVYELLASVYGSTGNFVDDFAERYPSIEALDREIGTLAATPGGHMLVATLDIAPVGFVKLAPAASKHLRHTAWLTFGVLEKARGHGVARALVEASLARAAQDRITEIVYLGVRADNAAAIRLNEAVGFEKIAHLTRDFKDGDVYRDGMIMRRFLTP